MFYRHDKTFWYQFCNFKHFLKAENSEDSLASSEFCISFHVTQYETWLGVTIGTRQQSAYSASHWLLSWVLYSVLTQFKELGIQWF